LLTAITAPATALLLRKEVAVLAGVSQAELEALYEIRPIARPAARALQKSGRAAPSTYRPLLKCLISQPELGAQLSADWHGEGAEAEAVEAVLHVLREHEFKLSSAVLMQLFQGTQHEKILAAASVDTLSWGESFDVAGEFAGLMGLFGEEQRRQQFQVLQSKLSQGGLSSLTRSELEQYKQLAKPSSRSSTTT
jgi:DNA primase